MKKFVAIVLTVVSVCALCIGLTACNGGEVYEGGYSYENYGHTYGQKVKVTVADGKITKVELVASDWVEVSDANPDYGWTEEMIANWNDNKADYLKSFEGKTVEEVLAMTVDRNDIGEPTKVTGIEVVTGATQSAGRVLLAVQDALKDVK